MLEDNFKIHKILDADSLPFPVIQSIDFRDESDSKVISTLKKSPWSHAHITDKSVTYDGVIHNLKTDKTCILAPPQIYFGLKYKKNTNNSEKKLSDRSIDAERDNLDAN